MKRYTFKKFLKGKFSIIANDSDIKDALNKLSQTNLRWGSGVKPNEYNPLGLCDDGVICLIAERGKLMFSTRFEDKAPLIRFNQLTIEDDDLKENYL